MPGTVKQRKLVAAATLIAVAVGFMLVSDMAFKNEMDWTGAGTLALAGGTVWLAAVTRQSIGIAQAELLATQRPVVVPMGVTMDNASVGPYDADAYGHDVVPGPSLYTVDVSNIGTGPCLRLTAWVHLGDIHGEHTDVPELAGRTSREVSIAAGADGRVVLHFNEAVDDTGFFLMLDYEDVAERGYITLASYDMETGGFTLRSVSTPAEGGSASGS